jgi:hypothetical protein
MSPDAQTDNHHESDAVSRDEYEALQDELEEVATIAGRALDKCEYLENNVIAELQEENQALRERLDETEKMTLAHEKRLDGIVEPSDGGKTGSPGDRANDLREVMIRRAKTRRTDKGKLALWKDEVKDLFVDLGYTKTSDAGTTECSVSKPDLYKAMRTVAEMPGFAETTKLNHNENTVEAVKVDVARVPGESVSRSPTTGGEGSMAADGGETTTD